MRNTTNIPLDTLNTLTVPCIAKRYVVITELESFKKLNEQYRDILQSGNFYLLGDGSNTLFVDDSINLVVKSALKGVTITETEDTFIVKAAAGENWHELVCTCVNNGAFGLENLVLIPGSVGAAPVQNIGAYGVEVADFCTEVEWFCFTEQKLILLSNEDCCFAYRESIFKHDLKNKGMITSVTFTLPKDWQANKDYQGLTCLPEDATPNDIMNKVIALRQSKLPDPLITPNAGSFFKNPVVSNEKFKRLNTKYADLPSYPQPDGSVKLAAGWLIEKAGLKGIRKISASIHSKQALVIVNDVKGSGKNIVQLAKLVVDTIQQEFGIQLEPEVRFIGESGEYDSAHYLLEHRAD